MDEHEEMGENVEKDEATGSDEPSRFGRIKQHLRENKKVYIAGTGGVIVGAVGVFFLTGGRVQIVDSIKLIHIQYKSPNINIALVKEACPEPIPVRYKPTGEVFRSIRRAGEALGMNVRNISEDAQGAQQLFERLPDSVFA